MDRTILTIMAHPRSGTNMLGWAIHSHPDIHFAGEVFHKNRGGRPRNERDILAIIAQYDDPGAAVICLDTKYPQITPVVEKFLRQHVKVIHLVREDTLRHWFSFQFRIAHRHPERGPARFQQEEYDAFRHRLTRLRKKLGHLEHLRLTYEEITDNRQVTELPERISRQICTLAGVPFYPLVTHTRKGAPRDIEGLW